MLLPAVFILLSLAVPVQSSGDAQAPATVDQANLLRSAGKLREARDAYEQVLKADPANAAAQDGEVEVSERMALDARAAGHMDEALKDLLQAQKLAPENPRLLYDLGILEDEMRLYIDADKTLAHLEQIVPDDPKIEYAVARVKLDLGQLDAAEAKMQAYLRVHPEDATAHYGLGRIYRLKAELDQARAEFQRSIELRPQQTEAYYQLGDVDLQQGDFAGALANFGKTLERNPRHGGALAGTGIAYFKQKQYDKAEEALEKAVSAAPDYQPGHYYLGLTLARLGKKEESERELALATKLADEDNRQGGNRLRLNEPPAVQ
jgi:tetratricopeptide (TPR) repeat protein